MDFKIYQSDLTIAPFVNTDTDKFIVEFNTQMEAVEFLTNAPSSLKAHLYSFNENTDEVIRFEKING